MATTMDMFFGGGSQSNTVPPVDPADVRGVWEMQAKNQALFPGVQIAISAEAYKQTCRDGVDVQAVFERLSAVGILRHVGALEPWLRDGTPTDAVFEVVATIPMNRMQIGVTYNQPQFDVEEFLKQVEARTQT